MKASGWQCQCKAEMPPVLQSRDVSSRKRIPPFACIGGLTSDLEFPNPRHPKMIEHSERKMGDLK